MATMDEVLRDLTEEVRSAVGRHGSVQVAGTGLDYEVSVRPHQEDRCPFVIHAESEDEITIEFGMFSVAHVASKDLGGVRSTCRDIVNYLVEGKVREIVWAKKSGNPCRAVAYVGTEPNIMTIRTRSGLCFTPVSREHRYQGYGQSLSPWSP